MSKETLKKEWLVTNKPSTSHPPVNVKKTLNNFQNDLQLLLNDRTQALENIYHKLKKESRKRRIANEAMAHNEKKISTLIDASSDIVWEVDTNFIITYVSPEVFDLLGYSVDEIIKKSLFKFIPPTEVHKIKSHFEKSLQNQCTFRHLECEILRKNGQKMILETGGAPYVSSSGTIQGFICISKDITKHKQMEKEIFKSSKLESLSVLAGGIAHDFNNMLTAINGNIALAKVLSEQGSKIETILNSAQNACKMATGLTRQLLTFSKNEEPVKKIVDIQKTIKETVQFSLRGSNIKYKFDIADDLFPVEIDKAQICQVINNLTINASQAMPDGGLLKMTGENIILAEHNIQPIPSGNYIKLKIIDQGVGIDEADLANIFDPYFTTKEKGNGLGLAVSYSIIKNHGGHLSVESKKGYGTIFYIYLPAAQANINDKCDKNKKSAEKTNHLKILLMDDEQIILDISKQILTHLGHEIGTARDGNEAVAEFITAIENNEPYSAVIMDLTIPGGFGALDTVSRLKQLDPEIKTIVASGYTNAPEMVNFSEYGFEGSIVKPYDIESLKNILELILNNS